MGEKPILFSAPMVRAILDGRKTQTRRVLKTPRGCPNNWLYTPGGLIDPTKGWWRDPEFDRVGWSSELPYLPGYADRHALYPCTRCGGSGTEANRIPSWVKYREILWDPKCRGCDGAGRVLKYVGLCTDV